MIFDAILTCRIFDNYELNACSMEIWVCRPDFNYSPLEILVRIKNFTFKKAKNHLQKVFKSTNLANIHLFQS